MHVCLNGSPVSFVYSRGHIPRARYLFPFSFPFWKIEALGTKAEEKTKKKEKEKNEVRDRWGSGSQDPGTHSPKYLRKSTQSLG